MCYIPSDKGRWYVLVHPGSSVFEGRGTWLLGLPIVALSGNRSLPTDSLASVLEDACSVEIPTCWKSGLAVVLFMLFGPLHCSIVLWAALGSRSLALKWPAGKNFRRFPFFFLTI